MTTVNIEDFQSDLSHLIDQAVKGEPLLITRAGKPLVTVQAFNPMPDQPAADTSGRFGFLAGKFTIPDDFDTYMQDEIIEMFEGRPDEFADLPGLISNEKPR